MINKKQIGFIGLGHMGLAIAERLLAAGHELTVFNRTISKAKALQANGARVAESPAELKLCDFIFTMLADDTAVNEVLNGPRGFAKVLKEGATHIAMSTISVNLSRKLSQQHLANGQHYVAAPVLGRPDSVRSGMAFILAAGERSPACDSILAEIGQKVFALSGEASRAHLVKLACNFMLTNAIESMAEAFALTRKGGVEPQAFFEIFSSTLFSAPVYKNYGSMILNQAYQRADGFKIPLAEKDVKLALTAGQESGVALPSAKVVLDRLQFAIAHQGQGLDLAALGKIAADLAGLK